MPNYRVYSTSWFTAKKKKRPEHVPQKIPGVVAINCIVNSRRCALSSKVKVLSPLFGRNRATGFKNEKKIV